MAKTLDKKVTTEKSWFTKRDLLESHKSMSQRAQKHFQSIEAIRWFWKTLLHISCLKWNGNNGVLLFLNILIYIVSLILYFCKVVKYIWKRTPKLDMVSRHYSDRYIYGYNIIQLYIICIIRQYKRNTSIKCWAVNSLLQNRTWYGSIEYPISLQQQDLALLLNLLNRYSYANFSLFL